MEYQRVKHGEEIVLTYCPARQTEERVLRYERELPMRMQTQAQSVPCEAVGEVTELHPTEEPQDPVVAALLEPKGGKRRSWITFSVLALCFVLLIGGIGAGVWGVADATLDFFSSAILLPNPDGQLIPAPDSDGNDGSDHRGENGNGADSEGNRGGVPQLEVYRPTDDTALRLVGVSAHRKVLSAGEIYDKVAPSTVTIIGIHGETYSVGTGVIFTSDGYIITNYHVIAGCLDCEVWVTNEYGVDSTYPAKFVGGDDNKDLAVLKIEAQNLPAAEFGISSDLAVGDKVYAIGNPLGTELRSTFTDGIISAVDRSVEVDGVTMTLLQTNTALNSGNSGGPLINVYGQVIGINTIKMMSGYDTIEGLGFAIPTSLAERWVNDILTTGEVRPSPILGLSVNRIPVRLFDGTVGLEVIEVVKNLSADHAGIQMGDVVVAFNGVPITSVDDIYAQRIKLSVGDVVSIRVCRNGTYLDLMMVMMAEP